MNAQNIAKQLMKHCANEPTAEVHWYAGGAVDYRFWTGEYMLTASVFTEEEDRNEAGKWPSMGVVDGNRGMITDYEGPEYNTDAGAVRAAIALMAEMRRDYGGKHDRE